MGRHRHHFQTKTQDRQFKFFETAPPTGAAPTPDWNALPMETRDELTGLMARLLADHVGGRAEERADEL